MIRKRIGAAVILIVGIVLGVAVFRSELSTPSLFLANKPFRLGLDLSGGSHLLYKANVESVPAGEVSDSMEALRDVIERRINAFGVGEPVVTTQTSTLSGVREHRLSIELPGVTDIAEAVAMIGQTPLLEFRLQGEELITTTDENGAAVIDSDKSFIPTALTGKYLQRAQLLFNPGNGNAEIGITFTGEGAKLFEEITGENIGKILAIYLDGQLISAPIIQAGISGGQAQITGDFTPAEAKQLVGRLNSGALPVPIELISTQTVGATLGSGAIEAGVLAALIGFIVVGLFLVVWYRLPGIVAVVALALYLIMTLVLYKLIPVTLTAAGIAGFIISIGIAVDANILIFERFREERKSGKVTSEALKDGFLRAWTSIRDANIAALIISVILFWFGSSLIKGFALTLGLGVILSMINAVTITKILLEALPRMKGKVGAFLFSSGFKS